MNNPPSEAILALARDVLSRRTPAPVPQIASPCGTKQQRLAALVAEIKEARDRDRAAALAVQIRDTIQEPEPAPAPKTPAEEAAQRIQDERDYFNLISKQKVTAA